MAGKNRSQQQITLSSFLDVPDEELRIILPDSAALSREDGRYASVPVPLRRWDSSLVDPDATPPNLTESLAQPIGENYGSFTP